VEGAVVILINIGLHQFGQRGVALFAADLSNLLHQFLSAFLATRKRRKVTMDNVYINDAHACITNNNVKYQ